MWPGPKNFKKVRVVLSFLWIVSANTNQLGNLNLPHLATLSLNGKLEQELSAINQFINILWIKYRVLSIWHHLLIGTKFTTGVCWQDWFNRLNPQMEILVPKFFPVSPRSKQNLQSYFNAENSSILMKKSI